MANKVFTIPSTDITITARNQREERLAWIFCYEIEMNAKGAADGDNYGVNLLRDGCTHRIAHEMDGEASAMYYLGMLKEPVSSVVIADAIEAEYRKICAEREEAQA